jgi:hypothetical protein
MMNRYRMAHNMFYKRAPRAAAPIPPPAIIQEPLLIRWWNKVRLFLTHYW